MKRVTLRIIWLFTVIVFCCNIVTFADVLQSQTYNKWLIMFIFIVFLLTIIIAALFVHIKRTEDNNLEHKIQEKKHFAKSIVKCIENNEFKMYLQFVVDNKTNKIVSAETLSRWHSPKDGVIGPGMYIGEMESAGVISKHDFYMFEQLCAQLEKWNDTQYKDISISCNFTRLTLSEENFINTIRSIADKYDFDKTKLAIEITEETMEKDKEIAAKNVMLCKEMGFRIYLDDLGSGYTSLANLCDYPIDVVKIDRNILLKADSKRGNDLFSGIIALAHSLNLSVICEGVETEEQNTFVHSTDCDFVQGWYFSKPVPVWEAESFVQNFKS